MCRQITPKLLISELNREIGYQIPSRGLIVLLLGGHFACLGMIGIYLTKTRSYTDWATSFLFPF